MTPGNIITTRKLRIRCVEPWDLRRSILGIFRLSTQEPLCFGTRDVRVRRTVVPVPPWDVKRDKSSTLYRISVFTLYVWTITFESRLQFIYRTGSYLFPTERDKKSIGHKEISPPPQPLRSGQLTDLTDTGTGCRPFWHRLHGRCGTMDTHLPEGLSFF